MKKFIKKFPLAMLSGWIAWLAWSTPVMAASLHPDTGDAVSDILLDPRFQGAMHSIEWLTGVIDIWFVRIISIGAFLIISVSMARNVAAGIVCAYPKFWRKVHEAHEKHAISAMLKGIGGAVGSLKGGGAGGAASGMVNNLVDNGGSVILGIIPDLLAFTDFADNDMSPKQYFMKAIPEMLICVFIGIFIYNGLYRDVAAKVGTAGAHLVSNTLNAVDPDAMTKFIFNRIENPDNTFKDDPTIQGSYIRELSNAMYTKLLAQTEYFDGSSELRRQLMNYCETWAQDWVNNYSGAAIASTEDLQNTDSANPSLNPETDDSATIGGADGSLTPTSVYQYEISNVQVTLTNSQVSIGNQLITTPTSEGSAPGLRMRFADKVAGSVIPASDTTGDSGLSDAYITITANFTAVARNGVTYDSALKAVNGSLGGSGALPRNSFTMGAQSFQVAKTVDNTTYYRWDMQAQNAIAAAIQAQLSSTNSNYSYEIATSNTNPTRYSEGAVQLLHYDGTGLMFTAGTYTVQIQFSTIDESGNKSEPTPAEVSVTIQ